MNGLYRLMLKFFKYDLNASLSFYLLHYDLSTNSNCIVIVCYISRE